MNSQFIFAKKNYDFEYFHMKENLTQSSVFMFHRVVIYLF